MLNHLLSLFLKPNCPFCQRSAEEVFCNYCSRNLFSCEFNPSLMMIEDNFLIFPWGKYDRYLKRAIAQLKFQSQPEIGEILGEWLGQKWVQSSYHKKYSSLVVIPVPAHKERIKTRGYNQAELIAHGFCHITKYPLHKNLVIRQKNTQAMYGLNLREKKINIQQAFKIGKDYQKIKPQDQILIIDDIYTTGTTVNEIKKVLTDRHLNVIGVATVSKGMSSVSN
jgi:ComF family protein